MEGLCGHVTLRYIRGIIVAVCENPGELMRGPTSD